LILGLSISLFTLYLSFRTVHLEDILDSLARVQVGWLVGTLAVMLVNHLGKTLRWKFLLAPSGQAIPFRLLLGEMMTGQMWNLVTPARLGDLTRIHQVGVAGPGRTFVLSTLVIEKTVDMLAYAFLFIWLMLLLPLPDWLMGSGLLFSALAVVFFGLIVLVALQPKWSYRLLDYLAGWLPARLRNPLLRRFRGLVNSLTGLKEMKIYSWTIFWTVIIWFSAIATNLFTFYAFGLQLDMRASIVLLLALQAGISIPSMPARIGVFEYICILSLGLFGVDQAVSLSFGILLHFLVVFPILAAGVLFFTLSGQQRKAPGLIK
jgi:uncharacterized protein (TIRG00374 family)